jgi:hypothetical protein
LPAYEELVNMSTGDENTPLNGRPGAGILYATTGRHWSSTNYHANTGRYKSYGYYDPWWMVHVDGYGKLGSANINNLPLRIRCAWRP